MKQYKCLKCGRLLTLKQINKKNTFCSKACATSYRCNADDPDITLLDDEKLYYLLGLIFTDGNLNKEKTKITISSSDEQLATDVYSIFSNCNKRKLYSYKPKSVNAKTNYLIINGNKKSIQMVQKFGITPNKSMTKKFPYIPYDYIWTFIRGVFDGDGSVYILKEYRGRKYLGISFTTGSRDFANGLYSILTILGIEPRLNCTYENRRKTPIYYLQIAKQKDVKIMYNQMYKDATIYMKRKYDKFNE